MSDFDPNKVKPDEEWESYEHMARNPADRDIMKAAWDIFAHRLFPILSLAYIASVIGIDLSRGDAFLQSASSFYTGFIIMGWVSIPPFMWMFIRSIYEYRKYADRWYIWSASSLALCGVFFYFLFPDEWLWVFKYLFVASIPIHIMMYFFFLKESLPPFAAWPLTLSGIVFMLYGMLFS